MKKQVEIYDINLSYLVPASKRCKGCGRTLKNKKKYRLLGLKVRHDQRGKRWFALKKQCKKCGYVNIPHELYKKGE